jgi:hypothetical protein
MQCDFAGHFPSIKCGVNSSYPEDKSIVKINQCLKDKQVIFNHLKYKKFTSCDVQTEGQLILFRCGYFVDNVELQQKIICPNHRYKIGLRWNPSKKCQHPLHKEKGKPNKRRIVKVATSRQIYERWGFVLPIGSRE